MPDKDVYLSIPVSDILSIFDVVKSYPALIEEISSIKQQVNRIRNIQTEIMCIVGDLRREKK